MAAARCSRAQAVLDWTLRSKSDTGQINEVLCKVIAHNLCVLIACIHEIGLDVPTFDAVGSVKISAG